MEQLNIFDIFSEQYKIRKPVRLIELFAGVGSQAMALKTLGVTFEHHRVVEFDKFAIQSYNSIHGTHFETTDIRDLNGIDLGIEDVKHFTYLLTYLLTAFHVKIYQLRENKKECQKAAVQGPDFFGRWNDC